MERKISQVCCCSCGTTLAETKGKIKTVSEYWVAFCGKCYDKIKEKREE
jgi:hypothetical protein